MSGPDFNIPPMLIMLCAAMGAAAFFAPHLWLWQRVRGQRGEFLGFRVFALMMGALFSVSLFSLIRGFYDGLGVLPLEAFVVFALSAGAFVYLGAQGYGPGVCILRAARGWLMMNMQLAVLMLVTIVLVQAVMVGLFFLNARLETAVFNPVREAAFTGGVFWLVALYGLFRAVRAADQPDPAFKFHHVLWPLALGLFLLMIPMLVQHLAVSEKFYDMMHRPPRLQKA